MSTDTTDTNTKTVTEYIVLCRLVRVPAVGSAEWKEVGHATANDPRNAIKTVADDEGTYVAVPARSWKPLTRNVETVKKDVWT